MPFIHLAFFPSDDDTCGPFEEFNNCGTQCEQTCHDLKGPPKVCNHMCVVGCFCIEGYVRKNDQNSFCVKHTDC